MRRAAGNVNFSKIGGDPFGGNPPIAGDPFGGNPPIAGDPFGENSPLVADPFGENPPHSLNGDCVRRNAGMACGVRGR